MRKLLILGAGNHQVHLIQKAREMGLFSVVISPDGDYPGLSMADKICWSDVRDMERCLEIAKAEGIEGVVYDQGDVFVRTGAYIAEKMGLPGIGCEAAELFTDKYQMREKCEALGLNSIEHALVSKVDDAIDFYRSLDSDAIIKPVDSAGSRGVSKITSEQDLVDKFEGCAGYSTTGEVIIERFVCGREYEVDSIVFDGKCKEMMYGELNEFSLPDVFACTTIIFPADCDDATADALLKFNRELIEGFGLKQGLAHAEYIQDEKTGRFYLLEAAARGGGLYISSHVAELQTGFDTAKFLIEIALGELKEMPEFPTKLCHCGYVSFYLPEGEIVSMAGMDEALAMPFVTKSLIHAQLGQKTDAFSDKRNRNVIFLKADSREELDENIDKIRETVKIEVKTPRGIEGPLWF